MIKKFLKPTKLKIIICLVLFVAAPMFSLMLLSTAFSKGGIGGVSESWIGGVLYGVFSILVYIILYPGIILGNFGVPLVGVLILYAIGGYLFACVIELLYKRIINRGEPQ